MGGATRVRPVSHRGWDLQPSAGVVGNNVAGSRDVGKVRRQGETVRRSTAPL